MMTIDLAGPDGSAFALIGMVCVWGLQLGVDTTRTMKKMMTMSGDYEGLLAVFEEWCEEQSIDVELLRPEEQR